MSHSDSDSDGAYEDAQEDFEVANRAMNPPLIPSQQQQQQQQQQQRRPSEIGEEDEDDFDSASSAQASASILPLPEGVTQKMLHDNVMHGIYLFMTNQFRSAEDTFAIYSRSDPLHALASGAMAFLKAMMTFAENDFQDAANKMKFSQLLASSLLQKPKASYIGRLFGGSSKPPMTAMDLDCTLALAESYLLRSMLLFFQESIMSYVKAGLGLRKGWKYYEECNKAIAENAKKNEFEISADTWSGIQFGFGNFNMVISMLPAKILKIVSALGFPGDRATGLADLNKSLTHNAARSPLAGLSLLFYHVIFPSFFSPPDSQFHVREAERILRSELTRYPNSALHLMMAGRLARFKKDINQSIKIFEQAINAQSQFKQLQHLCYYDVAWSHIFNLNWNKAKPYFDVLLNESEWSKAFYTYMIALCLLDEKQVDRANYLLSTIPSLITRTFGGRTISVEQFVLKKVQLYMENGRCDLFLPQLEIAYLWNGMSQMTPDKLEQSLFMVERALASIKGSGQSANPNHEALCYLLKGAACKSLGRVAQARECFDMIEHMEDMLKDETWIAPHTMYEYGSMLVQLGDTVEGEKKLKKSRDKYTNYIFEVRLHLRLHLQKTLSS